MDAELADGVTTVRIDNPPVNAFDLKLVDDAALAVLTDEELDRLAGAARRTGEGLAKAGLDEALRANGYEPVERAGEVRFRNCPFHALVAEDRQTTCALNQALVEGMIAGSGDDRRAVLDPEEGYCCVRIRPD